MPTILYVDEHTSRTEGMCSIIRGAGYRFLAASHGEEAERLFAANQIDVAILRDGTDFIDGKYGETLAAHLKKIRPVRILVLRPSQAELAVASKSVDVSIVQPETPELLLEAVAHLLNAPLVERRSHERRRRI